jgi:pimeloyl-ACP methyl ester carboxylesterase
MGGPISLHLAHRHPDLVAGIVVQATALEWRSSWFERLRWRAVRLLGPIMRSWAYPRGLRFGIAQVLGADHSLIAYLPWLEAEVCRGDAQAIVQAGRALSQYDARPWVGNLDVPAASLITVADRLVRPHKQRALAKALHAHVVELDGDHVAMWQHPEQFSDVTLALVDHVTGRSCSPQRPVVDDQSSLRG